MALLGVLALWRAKRQLRAHRPFHVRDVAQNRLHMLSLTAQGVCVGVGVWVCVCVCARAWVGMLCVCARARVGWHALCGRIGTHLVSLPGSQEANGVSVGIQSN